MLDLLSGGRSAEDILGRVARVTLGGVTYELPVLPIAGNRRWKEGLDARLAATVDGLEGDNPAAVFLAIEEQADALLDVIIAYDKSGVLPPKDELLEVVYEHELIAALREVWRAANPFATYAIEAVRSQMATTAPTTSDSSPPTSTPPRRTGGRRKSSKVN